MKVFSVLLAIAGGAWYYHIVKTGFTDIAILIPPACLIIGGAYLFTRKRNQ